MQTLNDQLIRDLNEHLSGWLPASLSDCEKPKFPVIFIVGSLRTGSTFLMQLLMSAFRLGYVNNLTAKFWQAPYLGAALTRLLRAEQPPSSSFSSAFGFTEGYDEPHEFGYFWRRWFPYGEHHYIEPECWPALDMAGLRGEIARLEAVWERPLCFKNPAALPLQISLLHKFFPDAVFINTERDPLEQMYSVYQSRRSYTGSATHWFGIKPPNYAELKTRPVPEQIAGQVFTVRQAIRAQLQGVPARQQLTINYQNLSEDTETVLEEIADFLRRAGVPTERQVFDFQPITPSEKKNIPQALRQALKEAYERFEQ